ncbi:MAG TPA: PDZ domain-containing protein [Thermoanaerobaculia bacterium]|nr:PDZ domain-containing protein [Thermoanaerobaculia bacterium]
MRLRVSTPIVLALLIASFTLSADEPKCSSTARECEQEIRQMLSGRRYLGVQLVELKPGLVIKSVIGNSPASRAGLRENDRLVAVNGHSVTLASAREFKQILADARMTGVLFVIVQRRGAYKKVEVKLEPYSKEQIDKIINAHLTRNHPATAGGQ